jgi:hypothetical protein
VLPDFLDGDNIPDAMGDYIVYTLAWRIEKGEAPKLLILPVILAKRTDGRPLARPGQRAGSTCSSPTGSIG